MTQMGSCQILLCHRSLGVTLLEARNEEDGPVGQQASGEASLDSVPRNELSNEGLNKHVSTVK
jgi:hypothetical protein